MPNQLIRSQQIYFYGDKSKTVFISPQLSVFEDIGSVLNINDILLGDTLKFVSSGQLIPSYSFTKSTIWCKFKVTNKSNQDCYLEISPPFLNEIVCFQVFDDKADSIVLGSFYTDKKENAIESTNYVFKLEPNAQFYVLKIKSKTRLFIKAHLSTFDALVLKTQKVDLIQSMYAGLLIMIFIYNFFLFFSVRENIYLYYILHLTNSALYFLYMSGYGIDFVWPNYPGLNSIFISIICFGFILSLIFVVNFLETKNNLPFIHYILIGMMVLLALTGLLDIVGFSHFAGKLMNYIGFPAVVVVIVGTIKLAKRGFKPAFTFLYAWILFLIGIVIQTLQSLNYVPTSDFTSNSIQIGSAFEIILLSLAVGNKINFYKQRKLKAIVNEKNLLIEKEALESNQKENLEHRFQAVTETLYAKNKELRLQNREIQRQFEEISLQNKKILDFHNLLEIKNKVATKQKEELQNHVENLEKFIEERTKEIKETAVKAEEANLLKTAFLKDLSHEIRTPMNAIAGFSSLLMEIEMDDSSHSYYVDIIISHTDYLLDLIDNIVDLSRIQANQIYLKKVKFDPFKMFNVLLDKYTAKLKREKKSFVDLRMDLAEDKNLRLNLDYNRFFKVVDQLIDNSTKYTETGSIKFGFRKKEGGVLEIFVKDTGVGIKKEKLAVVFDSFRKVEKENAKLYAGIGLGLSLVKGLVTLMDGKLEIESTSMEETPGKQSGTFIRIEIPNAFC